MLRELGIIILLLYLHGVVKCQDCEVVKINITTVPQYTEVRVAISTEKAFDSVLSEVKCNRVIVCKNEQLKPDSLFYFGKKFSDNENIDIRARIKIFKRNEPVVTILLDQFGRVKSGFNVYEGTSYLMNLVGFEKVKY